MEFTTTCWSCIGGLVVSDPDCSALVCTLCGLVHEDNTAFTEEEDLSTTAAAEHGPVEPNVSSPSRSSLSGGPAVTTTCWSCVDGPVVTDPDSGARICTSCGLVCDAGDAEFVHRDTDFTIASLVHHDQHEAVLDSAYFPD